MRTGVHGATATGQVAHPNHWRYVTSWLSSVFKLNPAGLNWPRSVMVLDVMLVPLVVLWAVGHQLYLVSAIFGLLLSALADPGGSFGHRATRIGFFGLIGAGLTRWDLALAEMPGVG